MGGKKERQESLALSVILLQRSDDLSKILQRLDGSHRHLSAFPERLSVEHNRSPGRSMHLERGGLRLEGKQHYPEFPAPGFHPGRRVGLQQFSLSRPRQD